MEREGSRGRVLLKRVPGATAILARGFGLCNSGKHDQLQPQHVLSATSWSTVVTFAPRLQHQLNMLTVSQINYYILQPTRHRANPLSSQNRFTSPSTFLCTLPDSHTSSMPSSISTHGGISSSLC